MSAYEDYEAGDAREALEKALQAAIDEAGAPIAARVAELEAELEELKSRLERLEAR